MKARVYVSFKPTVLDPQGQTIQHALNGLGHKSIAMTQRYGLQYRTMSKRWEFPSNSSCSYVAELHNQRQKQ